MIVDGPLRVTLAFAPNDRLDVGRLAFADGVAYYEPGPGLAEHGVAVNPLWPVDDRSLRRAQDPRAFGGLHGVFADSLPDAWGRALMRRRAIAAGLRFEDLTPIDQLSWVGSCGMGALVYEPDNAPPEPHERVDLDALATEAGLVLEGAAGEVVDELVKLGQASGGTRPKVLVWLGPDGTMSTRERDGGEAWMVKFRGPSDPPDVAQIEAAYAIMARMAGLDVAPTRLITTPTGKRYFATRRFDRGPGGRRLHMISLAGALEADWSVPQDYDLAMRVVARVGTHADVEAMLRRAVFNVAAVNHDDHLKQHAFLLDSSLAWRLAPAYDLTYSPTPREHYLAVRGRGADVGRDDAVMLGREYRIGAARTGDIVDDVLEALRRFPQVAEECGLARATVASIMADYDRTARTLTATIRPSGG